MLFDLELIMMRDHLWHCVCTRPSGERVHGDLSYPRREAIEIAAQLNDLTTNGYWTAEPRYHE